MDTSAIKLFYNILSVKNNKCCFTYKMGSMMGVKCSLPQLPDSLFCNSHKHLGADEKDVMGFLQKLVDNPQKLQYIVELIKTLKYDSNDSDDSDDNAYINEDNVSRFVDNLVEALLSLTETQSPSLSSSPSPAKTMPSLPPTSLQTLPIMSPPMPTVSLPQSSLPQSSLPQSSLPPSSLPILPPYFSSPVKTEEILVKDLLASVNSLKNRDERYGKAIEELFSSVNVLKEKVDQLSSHVRILTGKKDEEKGETPEKETEKEATPEKIPVEISVVPIDTEQGLYRDTNTNIVIKIEDDASLYAVGKYENGIIFPLNHREKLLALEMELKLK